MKIGTITCAGIVAVGVLGGIAPAVASSQPVVNEAVEDVTVRVLVEGGKLLIGANNIVLELNAAAGPPDARHVVLLAARPGVPSESLAVPLSPDGVGRFSGTLMLPWTDKCRLEVVWDDHHGHHRHDFVVPVVSGHH